MTTKVETFDSSDPRYADTTAMVAALKAFIEGRDIVTVFPVAQVVLVVWREPG